MSDKQITDPGYAWNQSFGFSQAVRAGGLIFLSGQTPTDANGQLVGEGDPRAQTRQVFENIKTALANSGASLDDLVEIVSYHTDMADLPAMAEVKAEYITKDFPAWTALGVTSLAFPGQVIEIKAIAVGR